MFARGAVRVDPAFARGRRHRHRAGHARARGRLPDRDRQLAPRRLRLRPARRGVRLGGHGGVREPARAHAASWHRGGLARRAAPSSSSSATCRATCASGRRSSRRSGAGRRPAGVDSDARAPLVIGLAARRSLRRDVRCASRRCRRHEDLSDRRERASSARTSRTCSRAARRGGDRAAARRTSICPTRRWCGARVLATRPDAIVHAAIWNDPAALLTDRRRAWDAYVGATRNVVAAANAVDAPSRSSSTDWVFDGTQGPAARPSRRTRSTPTASSRRARSCRHRARPARDDRADRRRAGHPPRAAADAAGAGRRLRLPGRVARRGARAGERFAVWDGPGLNTLATPTLATDAAELDLARARRGVTGVLHCCGGEHADRVGARPARRRGVRARPELLDVVRRRTTWSRGPASRATRGSTPRHGAPHSGPSCPTSSDARTAPGRGGVIMERGMTRYDRRPGAGPVPGGPGWSATAARTSSPAASGSLGTATSPAWARRSTSPQPAPVPPGAQRAGDGAHRRRLRAQEPPADARLHDLGRSRRDQLVTGAALATINRLPVLLLPGDIVRDPRRRTRCCRCSRPRTRRRSVNDCFRPVSRYYDRVERPEQLIPAALEAMRVLTDPAETGAVTLALPAGRAGRGVRRPAIPRAARLGRVPHPRAPRCADPRAAELTRRAGGR